MISNSIRINQLGFYPASVKTFLAARTEANTFYVLSQSGEKVFKGSLKDRGTWKDSGETIKAGDFSDLTEPGLYTVVVDGCEPSFPFPIKENLYARAARDAMKTFYFQRIATIEEKYLPGFSRESHKDNSCPFHASTGRSEGSLNSPGGWYDAGDYGKYVVNGAFSAGILLALHEILPQAYPDRSLNIPESDNGRSDLLDEALFELNWILTMQDGDGGVFHKITPFVHDDFVMPREAKADRLVIGKSTAASLDFAAVLAQASRLLPEFGTTALPAAEKAWTWAQNNPEEYFSNPEGCNTGPYDDKDMTEERFWAASELFLTTGKPCYYEEIKDSLGNVAFPVGENWRRFVNMTGYGSLLASNKLSREDKQTITAALNQQADSLLSDMDSIPGEIPLKKFHWGSNSDILDGALLLCLAHKYSGKKAYLEGAEKTTDYLFGKNGTGLSYVTGYGVKTPLHPHHRLFHECEAPLPGFVVGGPNAERQDMADLRRDGDYYPSPLPARAYADCVGSYASNEICINWNAPAVFVLSYLENARS